MTTLRSPLLVGLLLAAGLAACSGAAAGPPSSTPTPTDPSPTEVPGGRSSVPPDAPIVGGGGGSDPGSGEPQLVVPKGNTLNPHPVSVESLAAQVDGRKAVVVATWWSGIEPCYVLDTVAVKQDGNDFTIALTEGSGDADAMCIEIAVQKATAVDLGELAPGEYTVTAQDGTAQPISFTID